MQKVAVDATSGSSPLLVVGCLALPKLGGRREEAVLVSRFDLARSNKMHSVTFEFSSFSVIVCVQK